MGGYKNSWRSPGTVRELKSAVLPYRVYANLDQTAPVRLARFVDVSSVHSSHAQLVRDPYTTGVLG